MSINKLALIRYKTIDDCLRNRHRKWTLEDLIRKVSEVLYEQEGIATAVSRRTIQADIQLMRSNKLGYNAPIVVRDRKFYTYEESDYSITKAPIKGADMERMKEIVGLLKQFNGFSYFEEMNDMIARLENNVYRSVHQGKTYIQLEDNRLLRGKEYITPLYQAILHARPLSIEYRSFRAEAPRRNTYYPYLLKEYRNRWFLICKGKGVNPLCTLALDRIEQVEVLDTEEFVSWKGVDFDRYFNDLIGVTKTERDRAHKVVLAVSPANAPYVRTKPLHPSQKLLEENENGLLIRIDVVLNFELEREILGFGEGMRVVSPRLLASRIRKRLEQALRQYHPERLEREADAMADRNP